MSEPELLYEVRDRIGWITINREARRNALSPAMIDLFLGFLEEAEADDNVRAICLTAAGEKVFCSGADLAGSLAEGGVAAGAQKYATLLKMMAHLSKPLVARVNGHCLAGGMGLMLACDMVYAADGATFGTPEVKVGLFPMMIGALIFRNASRKKALEMIYTARSLSAAEAEEMGLITRAVPAENLDRVVDETLAAVAAKAPLAIELGRQALAAVEGQPLDEALDYLCEQLVAVAATEDAAEGMTAFIQKRQPTWKGR
ncbi:MAG: enoyl-CoA hydratase/isomerase family protein [Desulfomonile tiedjei]|nr:enoyl-CoA hydratase/isomerase family protein [Desulfomonile tiedjei]